MDITKADFYFIAIVIFSLFIPFLTHLFLVRYCGLFKQPFSRQKGVIINFLIGFIPLGITFFLWAIHLGIEARSSILWPGVYLFSVYILSSYIYFHLFNTSETARRIKILAESYKKEIKKDELIQRYTYQDMVSNRLKRLLALGELQLSKDRYLLGHKILLLPARIVFALRDILFPSKKSDRRILLFLIVIIGLMVILNPYADFFKIILYPYHKELFAVLVTFVALFSLRFLYKGESLLNYLLVCIPYIMVTLRFLLLPVIPVGDSLVHFPVFKYIGDTIAHGYLFPEWFPSSGGVRIGFYHINLFTGLLLPHRILGYYLYSIIPASALFVYKLQYILGVIFMCFGWWLVLRELTGCKYAAYFGTLMIMMGGTGITFHQEQVVITAYLIPWFVLSLLKIRKDSTYIFPAVVLFALGLTIHYPQIQLISMGLLVFLMVLLHFISIKNLYQKQKRYILLLLLLFILAVLPSYYLFRNLNNLASPMRETKDNFSPQTYEEYLDLNTQQDSSANHHYYYQYIMPFYDFDPIHLTYGSPDGYSFFVGRIALVLVLIGIFLNFRKTAPIVFLLICFILLTFGINCIIPLPKYLYLLHFPFINVFRQWLHFFPMVNFCLSAIAAVSFAGLVQYFRKKSQVFFSILIMPLLFFQIVDLALYDNRYISMSPQMNEVVIDDYASGFFYKQPYGPGSVFLYKNRYKLFSSCPEAIPTESFLTTDIVSVMGGQDKEYQKTWELQSEGKNYTVTNIPVSVLKTFLLEEKIPHIPCVSSVNPQGISFKLTIPESLFLVTPLNYDLGAKAYVDGKEVKAWRVNSALSGIVVEKGKHRVRWIIPADGYGFIVLIQMLIYIFLALFFIYKLSRESASAIYSAG